MREPWPTLLSVSRGGPSHTFHEHAGERTGTCRKGRSGRKHSSLSERRRSGCGSARPLTYAVRHFRSLGLRFRPDCFAGHLGSSKKGQYTWAIFGSFPIYCLTFPTAKSVCISCWKSYSLVSLKNICPPTTHCWFGNSTAQTFQFNWP